jgi:hypothetical protein
MRNDRDWEAAKKRHGSIPFIPKREALLALEYLTMNDPKSQYQFAKDFERLGLRWYLFNGLPSPWWKGANLNDDDFREKNMDVGVKILRPSWDPKEVLQLSKIVIGNNLRPAGIEEHEQKYDEASDDNDDSGPAQVALADTESGPKPEADSGADGDGLTMGMFSGWEAASTVLSMATVMATRGKLDRAILSFNQRVAFAAFGLAFSMHGRPSVAVCWPG